MQAVILAGGLGTRLGDLTKNTPKPLIPVANKPFLDHLIWNLSRFGIDNIVLATSYLSDMVREFVYNLPENGPKITIAIEDEPLGTGGGLRNCLEHLEDSFFVLNGDTLFDVNYFALTRAYADMPNCEAAVAMRRVPDVGRYGRVITEGQTVTDFAEKSGNGEGVINGGIYYLNKSIVETIPANQKVSLETDVMPRLVDRRVLAGVELDGYFIDIGLPETLSQANKDLIAWRQRPIAFLDRDGVINHNTGYLHRAADCKWVDGAPEAIRDLNEAGYLVIVVTNQAGIGRGYYTEETFLNFMKWFRTELANYGAHLDDVFFSPYHPTAGQGKYLRESDCRKPNPGMLLSAFSKWTHKKDASFLIGDKESDILAAKHAGITGHLFEAGNLQEFVSKLLA